jgi:prevent-host-death family protein
MKNARLTIPAGQFKARCLGILDQVARTGESVVVTKRGKPVAQVVPVREKPLKSLRGSVTILADIVGPICADWDADA